MSRKADIAAAIKAAGGWHVNAVKVKESVNLAYDLGVQEGLRLAEREINNRAFRDGTSAGELILSFAAGAVRDIRRRKGYK